jgi:hypothetical protein
MSSDSSFEELSYGGVESEACQNEQDNCVDSGRVQVEIPPDLLQRSTGPHQKVAGVQSEVSSLASSFLPVNKMSDLAIQDEQDGLEQSLSHTVQASENDGWSYAGSLFGTQASASIAPSMISGFEVINIDGSTVRRCNHCSYLNEAEEGICQVCGVALVANPNVDVDLQIALHLNQKFEDEELSRLRQEEKKRKNMREQPLLERARALTSDVLGFLQSVQGKGESFSWNSKSFHPMKGIAALPAVDLLHLTSSFIPAAEGSKDSISFAYVFTLKESFNYICKNGFNSPVQVSNHIEAAFTEGFTHAGISTCKGSRLGRNPVYAVCEDSPEDIATTRLGWIVAITNQSSGSERSAEVSSGTAPVSTLSSRSDCLPLVCFDASIRDNDIIRRLLNGCTQVFHDFFYSCSLEYEVAILEDKRGLRFRRRRFRHVK